MKYIVAIETVKMVEVDAETEDAAIDLIKQKLNLSLTTPTTFKIVKEVSLNEKTKIYETPTNA